MAKGNLILGTAKNSVGDVVMYRREGAQITRVRVRNVKNPKTDAQSFQRAIMAPIAKFYSPLSVVLERSFEGLSKAKSHNKFNQVNANLARKNKWALPKGTGFFPLPYQLSQGTIPSVAVSTVFESMVYVIGISGTASENLTIGALSANFVAAGYHEGDVVTIIAIGGSFEDKKYYPVSMQFAIDSASAALVDTLSTNGMKLGVGTSKKWEITHDNEKIFGCAVIVSRFDGTMWRRSTQSLVVDGDIMTDVTQGTAVAAAIASYGMTAGDGNPLVYLDGDELTDGQ